MKRKKVVLLVFSILLCSGIAFADTVNVPGDQPTIQAGINASFDGDIVLVQPGTYNENINYNGKAITVGSLFLTTQDTIYISQTIIEGNQSDSAVLFQSGEDSTSVLIGFNLKNHNYGIFCQFDSNPDLNYLYINNNISGGILCYSSHPNINNVTINNNNGSGLQCNIDSHAIVNNVTIDSNNGNGLSCYNANPVLENVLIINNSSSGIICSENSNPILENVIIENNSTTYYGGGIYLINSDISISNSKIKNNTCSNGAELGRGGAMYVHESTINLIDCDFSGNSATSHAGAIYLSYSSADINRCTFVNNTSEGNVGGIYSYRSNHLDITNCTFFNNSGSDSGAMRFYDPYPPDIPVILNTISWNNSPNEILCSADGLTNELIVGYSDYDGGLENIVTNNNANIIWLDGNLNTDPFFVDTNNENYHLLQNSPCIDSGIAYYEYEGEVLIDLSEEDYFGIAPDMGAFECELFAEFEANETEVSIEQEILFSDQSIGNLINWQWDFDNNGIIDSNEQNPTYSYSEAGIYTVSLTIGDGTSSSIETKVDYINVSVTGTEIETILLFTELIGNYPNPFNPTTTISFSIPNKSKVDLTVYNIKGQKVKTLANNEFEYGDHSIVWEGDNESGEFVDSGIYLYKLNVNGKTKAVKKCLLLK